MKRSVKQLSPQMNLPLDNVPHAENPEEQCEDLTAALMELLISAAEEKHEQPGNGGEMNPKLTPERLLRTAIVYVRQSTPTQVTHHLESQRRQYGLEDRARELGFQRITVIDEDLGRTGSGLVDRPGFQRLLAEVCTGEVGAVFCIEASRLATQRS